MVQENHWPKTQTTTGTQNKFGSPRTCLVTITSVAAFMNYFGKFHAFVFVCIDGMLCRFLLAWIIRALLKDAYMVSVLD